MEIFVCFVHFYIYNTQDNAWHIVVLNNCSMNESMSESMNEYRLLTGRKGIIFLKLDLLTR